MVVVHKTNCGRTGYHNPPLPQEPAANHPNLNRSIPPCARLRVPWPADHAACGNNGPDLSMAAVHGAVVKLNCRTAHQHICTVHCAEKSSGVFIPTAC